MNDVYDGPAQIRLDDANHAVRVRLTGHLDPIDGRYHWRGMVFDLTLESPLRMPQPVEVCIGDHRAAGQLTEVTPWSTYRVSGAGAPPYPLPDVVTRGYG